MLNFAKNLKILKYSSKSKKGSHILLIQVFIVNSNYYIRHSVEKIPRLLEILLITKGDNSTRLV